MTMLSGKARPVLLKTKRFALRSLKPTDASERWVRWLKDPHVMGPLNAPVQNADPQQLRAHIATADNNERYLIGIFDLESQVQIGFFMVEVDLPHRRATFNVVIGEKAWWGKGAVNEARATLLDEFFQHRNIDKAVGMPLARNFPAIFNYKAQGWRHEGTLRGHCRSVADGKRLDQLQFGISKEQWLQRGEEGQS